MKRLLIICAILSGSFGAFAQATPDSLITSLVNSVYRERVDPAAKFYYLDEKGEHLDLEKYDVGPYTFTEDKELLKDVPIDELVAATKLNTAAINWNNYHLVNARCMRKSPIHYTIGYRVARAMPLNTPDSVMQKLLNDGVIAFRVKTLRSQRQLDKATSRAIKRYERETPVEEKSYYWFSKPVFSKDRQYALIALNSSGRGCLYIFKLRDGRWIKVFQFNCWVV